MNCPRCQASVTAQDKYCPTCGLALEAAKKGAIKRPQKREYEEASTQLVDVDEFRKYMAKEGVEPSPSSSKKAEVTDLAAVSRGGAGDSEPAPTGPAPSSDDKSL